MTNVMHYFRYAKPCDQDEIIRLVKENSRWFSHLSDNHFINKINNKECIYENGVLITFKILSNDFKLGTYVIKAGNTVLEQLIKNKEKSNSNLVKHVFIKFLNCVSGYVYLAVNTQNYRAINFYNNMNMEKIGKTKLDYKDDKSLYVEGYVYKSKKVITF